MTSSQYDVVVVGAGPSGSMTARYAAMGGCRTLLIEKRQEIGSPVRCGEGLARHFVEDTKLPFDRKWVGREVKGAKIFSPNGTELTIEEAHAGNEVGIVLERDAFDKAVAKEAAKAGADIWLKTTATAVIKDDGWVRGIRAKRLEEEMNIEAKCIVAADQEVRGQRHGPGRRRRKDDRPDHGWRNRQRHVGRHAPREGPGQVQPDRGLRRGRFDGVRARLAREARGEPLPQLARKEQTRDPLRPGVR